MLARLLAAYFRNSSRPRETDWITQRNPIRFRFNDYVIVKHKGVKCSS